MMKLPKDVGFVIETIEKHGYEAVVVGGCVRDWLLGQTPSDFDVATSAKPEQIQQFFKHTIPTGIKHGTITVLMSEPIEVTTYRVEGSYQNHRHPLEVSYVDTIEQDLSRRDFTINAMAYHPKRGLIDPFGGKKDLENKLILCVNNPVDRFTEDALRILRAHRFAARFRFEIEENTMQAIQQCQKYLPAISVERIRHEVIEILRYNPYQIEKMTQLLSPWIPELEQCKNCTQDTKYHDTDVLHHTLRALSLLKPFDETLAYSLLIHDCGKPSCKETYNGSDHFVGHPQVGQVIAKRLCKDWKLTRYQRKWIPLFVRYHDCAIHDSIGFVHRFCVKKQWSHQQILDLFRIKQCDILAHSPLGKNTIHQLEKLMKDYEQIRQQRVLSIGDLPLDGNDLKQDFGLEGKEIKEMLDACLEQGFTHPDMTTKADYYAWIKRRGL